MREWRLVLLVLWCCAAMLADGVAGAADEREFFETRIRPVLVAHCYECHSTASGDVKGRLLVDHRDGLLKGGQTGPAVVPGRPEDSVLLHALRFESVEMPPAGKLPEHVIADFERWIRSGAIDPRDHPPSATEAAELAWKARLAERSQWWSIQPLKAVSVPEVADPDWSRAPVDRFIRAALSDAALSPAAPADALTLLRRVSFVLTGLPPQASQVETFPAAFEHDADAALAALVEELLASPHYGERFARHWMDVARYTDTYGYEWDNPAKGSWEYRDWLIRAFNDDIGFDQLVREQLAGDLLPVPRINPVSGLNESLIGPMFYHMGEHRHGTSLDFNGIHQEMINNKIDAFSKAFLAMTVACARCHDHKLDAISQADYYALAGVFMSPRWTARSIDAPGRYHAEIQELKRLRAEIRRELSREWQQTVRSETFQSPAWKAWAIEHRAELEKLTLDDPAWPLARLIDATDQNVADVWSKLSGEWQTTRDARIAANAKTFQVLTDFAEPGFPDGWAVEGDGIAHGYVQDGAPLVSLEGESVIQSLLPRGYHTHALSSKLPGAIRLPAQHDVPGRFVSFQLSGGEWSGWLVVPQNAFQTETVTFLESGAAPQWHSIADSGLSNGVTRVLVEVATASLNPNFPPRTGKAVAGKTRLPDADHGFDKRSWFSLTGLVTHDAGGAPQDPLDVFATLLQEPAPASVDAAWQKVAAWQAGAVERWGAGAVTEPDIRLINALLMRKRLPNDLNLNESLAVLVRQYRDMEARMAFPRSANSMDERGVQAVDYRLNVRGNVDEEGPAVPRGFLEVFRRDLKPAAINSSGRLELAEHLVRGNPQTARVYVNRVWQWVFGTGLVATPDDFGRLGERPSHPELLDWLAARFIEDGWSTRKLIRRLVLSRTFRQSGVVASAASERDPANRLRHHYSTRRLEAEAIRDSLLVVSGRLDPQLYGRPIKPPRPAEDAMKRLFSGPLDGHGRRSLYLEMSIMEPPKFLTGFNLPDLKLPTGRRDVTSGPVQALMLLNDPFVVQMAEHWAARLMQDGLTNPEQRVRRMFAHALGRLPSAEETQRWTEAVVSFAESGEVMSSQTAWAELAHALFNTGEFIHYR